MLRVPDPSLPKHLRARPCPPFELQRPVLSRGRARALHPAQFTIDGKRPSALEINGEAFKRSMIAAHVGASTRRANERSSAPNQPQVFGR
jgi:hypothetical protein